uniref:Uncharacterized protein n=1 Tax=Rhizophagus irregularis (strain DAOM 181602 / DAOM 197198 / MUCL 43194) TaxID=747089 RepID=U9UZM9_RHIID
MVGVGKKNFGPCSIVNCVYENISFRLITELAYQKCCENNMLEMYPYLEVGKQLCHSHYCSIVEPNRGQYKRKRIKNQECSRESSRKRVNHIEETREGALINDPTFASNVKTLTSVLYNKQRRESSNLELDPTQFQHMIEEANPELKGFFPLMVNTIIPRDRSAHNKLEAKKSIVALCYIIAGLRNKFVNQFKIEVGLYLAASGATWEAIDTMSSLGFSACGKTVADFQKKIQTNHTLKIENHFSEKGNCLHIYNVDDYHAIHEKRRPDTVSTSVAKHFTTCVAKPVVECLAVPLTFNGISIHNPNNIEAPRICWYLLNKYTGIFDVSYTNLQEHQGINTFDRIELLTVHIYDDAIAERKEERSMNGLQLIGLKEQNLHSMQDYLKALQIILAINKKTKHLENQVAPIVADWPGQLFIRKALTHLHMSGLQSAIPQEIKSFIPMLGPLHLSLNSREHVMIIYYSFFEQMFHFVFGERKKLAKKPKPWRINLLLELARSGWLKIKNKIMQKFDSTCKDVEYRTAIDLLDNLIPATLDVYAILFRSGSFEKYVETVFRIWTFALRWKRKNYNKAPLVFLSDLFYWQDTHHPFADAIEKYLSCFNDYYVENAHSRIRANTSSNATVENIIKQAYVIGKYQYVIIVKFKINMFFFNNK